jgi:hypothetical protein
MQLQRIGTYGKRQLQAILACKDSIRMHRK